MVAEHGYDQQMVKPAFNQLEGGGVGKQLSLDDLGLALAVGS